jgi:hypothetical protein
MLAALLALAAAQSVPDKLPPAQILPYEDPNAAAVMAPIQALFAAMSAGDSAAALRLVYPDGRVTANGVLPSGSGLRQESFAQFAARMKPGEGFQESITDPAIEVDGDIAMVWAPFVVRVGGKVINCGYDHFDLVRENGAWKVMNITFSSRLTGCPAE